MAETWRLERPHVVIVGGGFGGLEAGKALGDAPVNVTLVDRENHHLFQPLLYQVAMAGVSPADIAVPIRSVLGKYDNTRVLLGEVTAVDLDARRITLEGSETLAYDYLILAHGAKTNFFGNPSWAEYSLGLKTIDDALEIRRRVLLAFEAAERELDADTRRTLLTFVVIGGGPTGVEVAGAVTELGRFVLADDFRRVRGESIRVVLIEALPRLLPGGFTEESAENAKLQLEGLGVEVRLGQKVENIGPRGVELESETIEAATVLWTAGVRAKRLGETLGIELDRGGRIVIGQDCTVAGHPEVFAVGDAASFIPEGSDSPLPGVSPVAMQQGRYVARTIRARVGKRDEPGTFQYRDKGIMATIGRSRAVAESGKLRLSGLMAWIVWLVVHIWYLIGFRNRFVVLINWTWSYIMYHRGARLITGARPWDQLHQLSRAAAPEDEPGPDGVDQPEGPADDGARSPAHPSARA